MLLFSYHFFLNWFQVNGIRIQLWNVLSSSFRGNKVRGRQIGAYRISSPTTIIDAANRFCPGSSLAIPFSDLLFETFFSLPALSSRPSRRRYAGLYLSLLCVGSSRSPSGLVSRVDVSSLETQRAQFGTVSWMLPMDVYLGYQQTIVSKVSPSRRLELSGQQNAVQLSVPQPPWLRIIQSKQQQATKKEIKGLTPDHKACSRVLCMLVERPKHLWSTSPTSNQAWN